MRLRVLLCLCLVTSVSWAGSPLVLQSDFGLKDAAVASMKGVAIGVAPDLVIHDLTHDIPVFNIWEASLRLVQVAEYWPKGTVFVSVVDPGVGTPRKSVVLETRTGHYFVTPDNGTLTFVAEAFGISAVREIDEAVNRLANSEESYTFHGRDVYAYTGARLASGVISFEEVGRKLPDQVLSIPYQKARFADGVVSGNIPILDIQFGNVWSNIFRDTFRELAVKPGDVLDVRVLHNGETAWQGQVPYYTSFGFVELGKPILYLNSLNNVSLAINQGSFAETHDIQSGADWAIEIRK